MKLSPAQLKMLSDLKDGEPTDYAEFSDRAGGAIGWINRERVLNSLIRRGLIDSELKLTERAMIPQVYVDLDGTLADIVSHYRACFGITLDRDLDNFDKHLVARRAGFFADMPLLPDANLLWDFLWNLKRKPIVLTGIPGGSLHAEDDKRAMVARQLNPDAQVICCKPSEKAKFCSPGDVIIDDWEKYRDRWIAAGGRWITHTSAENSIQQLLEMGIGL